MSIFHHILPLRLLLIITSVAVVSCDNFFDVKQAGVVDKEDVWGDIGRVEHLLADIYAKTQYEDFSYYDGFWVFSQLNLTAASDESFPSWQGGDFGVGGRPQSMYGDEWFYLWPYDHIHSCNLFLENLAASSLDQSDKRSLEGEVRFLRAFQYFHLVKRYGGVPLVTRSVDYGSIAGEPQQRPREKEQRVWEFVFEELEQVEKLLPLRRESKYRNRVNRYVALALKSRAMLYAGSVSEYGEVALDGAVGIESAPRDYWQRSFDASKAIIDSAVYSLYERYPDKVENYRMLFLDKNNNEYIWAKEYSLPSVAHDFDKVYTPYSFVGGYGCGMNPTLEFVEAYEYADGREGGLKIADQSGRPIAFDNPQELFAGKDPRLFASIYLPNSPCRGSIVEIRRGMYVESERRFVKAPDLYTTAMLADGREIKLMGKDGLIDFDDVTKSGFYQRKFLNEHLVNIDFGKSDQSWPLFRLGEIYLNLAEAAFMLGEVGVSLDAINKVRVRAGIRPIESGELTLEKIRHERRIELAFEHHRFWDLRRWRTAASNGLTKGVLYDWQPTALYPWIVYESGKYIFTKADTEVPKPHKMFFPRNYYIKFKAEEMTSNKLLIQNPGY